MVSARSNTLLTRRHLCRDLGHRVNKAIVPLRNECIHRTTPRASIEELVYSPKAARASNQGVIYKELNSQVHSLKSKHGRKSGAPESTVLTAQNKCVPNSFCWPNTFMGCRNPAHKRDTIRPSFVTYQGSGFLPGRTENPAGSSLRTGFGQRLNNFFVEVDRNCLVNKNQTLVTVVLLTAI